MRRFFILGFGLLMVFDTLAQVSFKLTANNALPLEMSTDWLWRVFGHPWIYGAGVGYIGAFFTWMVLLRRLSVGPAFAASHLEVVSVMVLSAWLFQEAITLPKIIGALLILAGIGCLAVAEEQIAKRNHDTAS